MLPRVIFTACCLAGLWLLGASPGAQAQQYPTTSAPAATGLAAARLGWGNPLSDARYQIVEQALVPLQEGSAKSAELIRFASGNGSYLYISRPIDAARVIEELQIQLAIKADRPDLELLAHVVLPRSLDPTTGKPVTCLISGGRYATPGHWQTLRLAGLPLELERQARLLRTRPGLQIDTREAFVDSIIVNLYSGPGNATVMLGELEVAGLIHRELNSDEPVADSDSPRRRPDITIGRPRLDGAILLIENRPFFPRSIDHRGEALTFLQQLGFNTIRFKTLPDEAQLDEAAALGLWIICPPPFGPPVADNSQPPADETAPDTYDPVLAWDLGHGLTNVELPAVKGWAEQIRRWDRDRNRPLVGSPMSTLAAYSRHLDILLLDRTPLGTSDELADYAEWLRQRPRLARPGTRVWTALGTQPAPALVEQCRVLAANGGLEVNFAPEQIRLLVYLALSGGSRGLLIGSESRLDATDLPTRLRAETLELLNMELGLIETWLAAGQTASGISSSEPQARGGVVLAEQARILLPIWVERGAQFVPGQSAGYNLSFLIPGIPESHEAYELTAAGLSRPKSRRVAGGMRVTLDEFDLTSLVALTQDPLIVSSLDRRVRAMPDRAVALARDLAVTKLMRTTEIDRALNNGVHNLPQAATRLESARKSLAESDRLLGESKQSAAYREVQRTTRPLRYLERAHWDASVARLSSPVASPLAVTFGTLVEHEQWFAEIARSAWTPTAIRQGEFESLELIQQAGWRYFQHVDRSVVTSVGPSPDQPHGGRQCLHLRVAAANPQAPPSLIETAPLWITSPAVPVSGGQTVRIRGWVRIRQPIVGSVDGLMILDSLSGEALAERIDRTEGWKEFVLYRAAPRDGRLAVTFALTGVGEAWLDDVHVDLRTPAPSEAPPTEFPTNSAPAARLGPPVGNPNAGRIR